MLFRASRIDGEIIGGGSCFCLYPSNTLASRVSRNYEQNQNITTMFLSSLLSVLLTLTTIVTVEAARSVRTRIYSSPFDTFHPLMLLHYASLL